MLISCKSIILSLSLVLPPRYYANYLEFFSDEVQRLGPRLAYQHYVFSEDANTGKAHMTERFVGGACA